MFWKKVKFLFCLCMSLVLNPIFAEPIQSTQKINIISWWGYTQGHPLIPPIEKKCGVSISVDEYTSNQEFLTRLRSNLVPYDIAIFSETIYKAAEELILRNDIDLTAVSLKYNPVIQEHYKMRQYPKNVVFYLHSLSIFLWNEKNIHISETDTIDSIFEKSASKDVVIMNDPVEVWNLINLEKNSNQFIWSSDKTKHLLPLTNENFSNFIKKSNVYISNTYNRVYEDNDFSFAFVWTGVAAQVIREAKKTQFSFLVHPKLSYISTDLLSALNARESTICVANAMLDKEMLKQVIQSEYYFDSSLDLNINSDPLYKELYASLKDKIGDLQWIRSISEEDYKEISKQWEIIKRSSLN